ncbi:MAG: ribonuclease PH [Sandaracinus sp.]|nr:ribonuclease PH [Sandaracinus sp.]|tara:strand:+ start:2165 stop:2914 length:750 start_codon:yes stop_codon:yes gene_type:complete
MSRPDQRAADEPRPITVEIGIQHNPEGSVLYRCGGTAVLVSASIEDGAPRWLEQPGHGWLTAEYQMHPRANRRRQQREGRRGSIGGRTAEIQRLIGRALRSSIRLDRLGERVITIDCDVLDADGGTRTASVTGGFIALALALDGLKKKGKVRAGILRSPVAAISVGLLNDAPLLDLCYAEDRDAEVDLNVVGTAEGAFVEVQGTAEGAPVPREHLDSMLDLALGSMPRLVAAQRLALETAGADLDGLLG